MSIHGNMRIKENLRKKQIAIVPFYDELLQGCSYDLRLDKFFIFDKEFICDKCPQRTDTIRYFDLSEQKFKHENNSCTCARYNHNQKPFNQIKNDKFILLPKQRTLASSIEQIGSLSLNITTKIFSKSSWARHGLEVASCAGYGDPFYMNHWTFEIFNKNDYPVMFEYGMVIAQMSFEDVIGCEIPYNSKYNNDGHNVLKYTDKQRFNMMLPKSIKIMKEYEHDEQVNTVVL